MEVRMSNEVLWFIYIIVDLSIAILFYKLWGKNGLYATIIISTIVANLQVVKLVKMFGLEATLGNIVYASIFFATDILSEMYGKKEAQRGVWIGFASLILVMGWMQFALLFKPAPDDFAQKYLEGIFSIMPRIALGSLTAYIVSQSHDVWAYHFWKRVTKSKHLWMRNNFSTMVSQGIDSVIFCLIAFLGVFPMNVWWQVLLTTYLFKWIVALIDTPFVYLGRYIGNKYNLKNEEFEKI
jgi:uncharacterized integral membrane protein (TIGR00697 family)